MDQTEIIRAAEARADASVAQGLIDVEAVIAKEKDPIQRQILQGLLDHVQRSYDREQERVRSHSDRPG